MMMVRWKIFRFHAQISQEKQRDISPVENVLLRWSLDTHPQRVTTSNHG